MNPPDKVVVPRLVDTITTSPATGALVRLVSTVTVSTVWERMEVETPASVTDVISLPDPSRQPDISTVPQLSYDNRLGLTLSMIPPSTSEV